MSTFGNAIKVPAATLLFWTIKVLTTGMGETTSDYLVGAMNPKIAVLGGAGAFATCLLVQWLAPRYNAAIYWLAVLMVAIFGTMAADVLHRVLGLSYPATSVLFFAALLACFWLWQRSEGTLSIHSISTRRREAFYWTVVLLTFALGTALGDMTAHSLQLGYFVSSLLFGFLILLPFLAFRKGRIGGVSAFWSAYVLTRPLGASLADWFGAPIPRGGLGFGFGPVSLVLGLVFVVLVALALREGRGSPRQTNAA